MQRFNERFIHGCSCVLRYLPNTVVERDSWAQAVAVGQAQGLVAGLYLFSEFVTYLEKREGVFRRMQHDPRQNQRFPAFA